MIGNWIDLAIIFYLLVSFLGGIKQGLVSILVNFASFVVALVLTVFTAKYTASFLIENFEISLLIVDLLSFFVNFLVFKIVLSIIIFHFASNYFPKITKSVFNKFLGGILSAVYGAFVIFIILSIFLSLSLPSFINDQIFNSRFGNFTSQDPLKLSDKFENIFGDILKETISKLEFLTVDPDSVKKYDINFEKENLKFDSEAEIKMFELVNEARKRQGLSELEFDKEIQKVAQDYAMFMFENGYISHQDLDGNFSTTRLEAGEIEFVMNAENIALSKDTNSAFIGLMESEGHRKNILFPFFKKIGIGAVNGGDFGMLFVQNFTD